jgi:hypothetical protein
MQPANRAVRLDDTEVAGKGMPRLERLAHVDVDAVAVLRVNAGKGGPRGWCEVEIGDTEEPVELITPRHGSGLDLPLPTPDPGNPLSFGQLLLAVRGRL